MADNLIANVWPEWQIEEQLGKGSYGVVYKAVRHERTHTSISAIKVISIPQDSSEIDTLRSEGFNLDDSKTYFRSLVDEFVSEIELMESFKGIQNIVSVEDYKVVEKTDKIGWDIFIRMELLTPLNSHFAEGVFSEAEVIKLGSDICSALDICSRRNIIHRDIKPENIFINDFGFYKLGDFGIARKLENMTAGLSQKGTYNYMAPEVFYGHQYDARVDIYSLGIVLYRLLNSNRLPFLDSGKQLLNPNERKLALEKRLRGDTLPPPCNASSEMSNLILRACAYDPNQRFASAAEMKEALTSIENKTYQILPLSILDDGTATVMDRHTTFDGGSTGNVTQSIISSDKNLPSTYSSSTVAQSKQEVFVDSPVSKQPLKQKKKRKAPLIAAIVIIAAIIVATALFFTNFNPASLLGSLVPGAVSPEISKPVEDSVPPTESQAPVDDAEPVDDLPSSTKSEVSEIEEKEPVEITPADTSHKPEQQLSFKVLEEAESLAENNDYLAAIEVISGALEESPDNPKYLELYEKYSSAYEDLILNEAADFSSNGDYESSIKLLKSSLEILPGNEKITLVLVSNIGDFEDQVAADVSAKSSAGDYAAVIKTLDDAIAIIGNDSSLSSTRSYWENTIVEWTQAQAALLTKDGLYSEAVETINNSLTILPNNTDLTSLLQKTTASQEATKNVSAVSSNPNQNPVLPKTAEEHDIVGGSSMDNAVAVIREDIYHASFEAEGVTDWYKVTTSSNYSAYRFELKNNNINTDLYCVVYDSYQNKLGEKNSYKGATSYLDLTLESDTTYWIQIRRNSKSKTGNYQFCINEKICDAGNISDEAFAIDLDTLNTKSISVYGISDWYKFTTTANYSSYQFYLMNNNINSDLYITVYDEYGTKLGDVNAYKGYYSTLDLALDANKTYKIQINPNSKTQTGNYQFSVTEKIRAAGLSMSEAFPVNISQTYQRTFDTTFDDWYTYTFSASGDYTLSLTNNSINTDLYVKIFDTLGTEIFSKNVYEGKSLSSVISVEAGTTLYVCFDRNSNKKMGNYTFSME